MSKTYLWLHNIEKTSTNEYNFCEDIHVQPRKSWKIPARERDR